MPHDVTDETFQAEILDSDQYVLVDFWAPWCGPCNAMAPAVSQMGSDYPDLKVCKVNVDGSPNTAATYDIRGIPAFFLFKDGKVLDKKQGSGGGLQGLKALVDPYFED